MKLESNKHNHNLTKLLKVLIFALVMLFPLGNMIVRNLYVICNKNAYQSYSGNNVVYEFEEINSNLQYNKEYYFNTDSNNLDQTSNDIIIVYSNTPIYENNNLLVKENKLYSFKLYKATNQAVILQYYNDNNTLTTAYFLFNTTSICNFKFTVGSNFTIDSKYNDYIKEIVTTNANTLDNAFEYSFNNLENSNTISWTKNTAIFTGVNSMTTQLGITGNTIPCLLTYWFFMIVIYIIIDILIETYTAVTHIFIKKTN